MAFAAALVPYLAAAGAVYQGVQAKQSADYNSKVAGIEQSNAVNQADAQEGLVRRSSREALGRQAAAFGAAGVGYGGSSAGALDQSAVNQELDALTTRYKGAVTGWGYGAQSSILRSQGNQDLAGSALLAGSKLLGSLGSSYNLGPKTPSAMAGTSSPQSYSGLGGPP